MKKIKNIGFIVAILLCAANPLHAKKQTPSQQKKSTLSTSTLNVKNESQKMNHQLFTILRDRKKSEKTKYQEISNLFPSYWARVGAWFTKTTLPSPNVNAVRKDKTPLLLTVIYGYPSIADLLADQGAEAVSVVPGTGKNFFYAVEARKKMLLNKSKSIKALNNPEYRKQFEHELKLWKRVIDNLTSRALDSTPKTKVKKIKSKPRNKKTTTHTLGTI